VDQRKDYRLSRSYLTRNCSINLAPTDPLPTESEATIATNLVAIALVLASSTNVQLIVVGCTVDRVIVGCVDTAVIQALARLNIDIRRRHVGQSRRSGPGVERAALSQNRTF
jgi:hypothetical protein